MRHPLRSRPVVGAVDDQIVTVHEGDDDDEVQYAYEDLSGDTRDLFSVETPTARRLNETLLVQGEREEDGSSTDALVGVVP